MNKRLFIYAFCAGIAFAVFFGAYGQAENKDMLNGEFNLGMKRSSAIQYYISETEVISYALNGARTGKQLYKLYLKCSPAGVTGKGADEYTCMKFEIGENDSIETTVPGLEGWSYLNQGNIDNKNQIFGIEYAKFQNLPDAHGRAIDQDKAYQIYNAFIDFHSMSDVFGEPMDEGKGVQDLKNIGDHIIHAAANSEVSLAAGSNISEGSYFKNGEITLALKGLSVVSGADCALLDYDSGESSLKMLMKPAPNMEINVIGSSHYWGDIYKDLDSGWVRKATLREVVVMEITLPMPPNKTNTVVERNILLLNVPEEKTHEASN